MRILHRPFIAMIAMLTAGAMTLSMGTANATQNDGLGTLDGSSSAGIEQAPVVAYADGDYVAPTKFTLKKKNVVIKKKNTPEVMVASVKHNGFDVYVDALANVKQGSTTITEDSHIYFPTGENNVDIVWKSYTGRYPIGKFKLVVGPSEWKNWATAETGILSKKFSVNFSVKQGTKIKKPKAKKKGKTRTITSKVTYFDVNTNKWQALKKKTVTIEVRDAKGKKKWKKAKTVKTDKKGKISVKIKAKKTQQYRIVYKGTSKNEAKKSKTVKK